MPHAIGTNRSSRLVHPAIPCSPPKVDTTDTLDLYLINNTVDDRYFYWMVTLSSSYNERHQCINMLKNNVFIKDIDKALISNFYMILMKRKWLCYKFISKLKSKVRTSNIKLKKTMNEYSLNLETTLQNCNNPLYIHENLKTWWIPVEEFYEYAIVCLRNRYLLSPSPNIIKNPYTNNEIPQQALYDLCKRTLIYMYNNTKVIASIFQYFILDSCLYDSFKTNRGSILEDYAINDYVNNMSVGDVERFIRDFYINSNRNVKSKYEMLSKHLSNNPRWWDDLNGMKIIIKEILKP